MSGFGEPRQGAPVIQGVVQRFSQAVRRQHRVHSIVERGPELAQKRNSPLMSRLETLVIGKIPDLPLNAEDFLVEGQRLMRSARALQQIGRLHEASARVHIAGDLGDLPGKVKRIVAGMT